jgi:hypothetical protein
MKRTTLNYEELNKRVNEVFMMNDGDKVYWVFEDKYGHIRVCIENEIDQTVWDYLPDMTERPEAKGYIMGRRNNFND